MYWGVKGAGSNWQLDLIDFGQVLSLGLKVPICKARGLGSTYSIQIVYNNGPILFKRNPRRCKIITNVKIHTVVWDDVHLVLMMVTYGEFFTSFSSITWTFYNNHV